MKTIQYLLLSTALLVSFVGMGQQMKQHIEMKIDPIGNAHIKISMKMNAAGWQTWLQTSGLNPAALKRNMEKEMPAYFLDDFKLEKNDMERSFELSLKAYGVCKVDKKGNWILETDEKDVDLTKIDDKTYMYINSPVEFGGQVKQTTTITFPNEANDLLIEEDAYGKTIFKFDMEESMASFGLLQWTGIFLLLAGAVWFGKNVSGNNFPGRKVPGYRQSDKSINFDNQL